MTSEECLAAIERAGLTAALHALAELLEIGSAQHGGDRAWERLSRPDLVTHAMCHSEEAADGNRLVTDADTGCPAEAHAVARWMMLLQWRLVRVTR